MTKEILIYKIKNNCYEVAEDLLEKHDAKVRADAIDGECNMEEIYEIVGIRKDGNVRIYQSGTIKQIEENELLNQVEHKNINDILRDMDCFSDYKHYARLVL